MKVALVVGSSKVRDAPLRDAVAGLPPGSRLVLVTYVAPPELIRAADEVIVLSKSPYPPPEEPATPSAPPAADVRETDEVEPVAEEDAGRQADAVPGFLKREEDESLKAFLGRIRRRVRRRLAPIRAALEVHRRLVWRKLRSNPRALQAVMDADVLVAHDNTAVYAVWQVARRRRGTPAILTLPAAVNTLSAQTANPTGRPAPGT